MQHWAEMGLVNESSFPIICRSVSSVTYSEPFRTSKMIRFAEIVNAFHKKLKFRYLTGLYICL